MLTGAAKKSNSCPNDTGRDRCLDQKILPNSEKSFLMRLSAFFEWPRRNNSIGFPWNLRLFRRTIRPGGAVSY